MLEKIANILITMPRKAGDPTWYTSQWAHKMESMARSLGYNVISLKGDNVTYRNVNVAIERYKPRLFVHSGHGCPSSLNGQNECILTRKFSIDELMMIGETNPEKLDKLFNPVKLSGCGKSICNLTSNVCSPLCSNPTNVHLLKGSIIYAVSCHSAGQLGRCAIQYGVESYIGYNDLLLFPVDSMKSQDMFGEIHLEFVKHILMGETVEEADNAMRRMEDTYIRLYKTVKWIGLPLLWNHLHRKVLGNRDVRMY